MQENPPEGHYFAARPDAPSDPRPVDILLDGVDLTLNSDAGVFSYGRLDDATRILLETAPMPDDEATVLDLGCGYGPVALTVACRAPSCSVVAIDVNERARELTAQNARRSQLPNVEVWAPDEVSGDARFDRIYSNPPIRIGKRALQELLAGWLLRLTPQGHCYLVVGRHLGADSLAAWLTGQGYRVDRLASRRSYRILDVYKEN